MFCTSVFFDVSPEHSEAFAALSKRHASNSLTEEGCLQFEVCRHQENSNRFYFHEVYIDKTAVDEVHEKAPYLAEFRAATAPWLRGREIASWDRII